MLNPQPAIDRAESDLVFARRIELGGLDVARERYNYNVARRIVSAIKRVGLPSRSWLIDHDGGVYLFTLEPVFATGYGPLMEFYCNKDDSLQTAIMGSTTCAQ